MYDDSRKDPTGYPVTLGDSSAHAIAAGDLEAVFLPGYGMICSSLRHQGVELLRCIEDLEERAVKGKAAGIPFLHPWANRLAGYKYRAAGREVALDPSSPLLHLDDNGLLIHGVPWSRLAWDVNDARKDGLVAQLDWVRDELLDIFPFRHRIEIAATLRPEGLTLETTLIAKDDVPVPVSFGFHPYFGLSGLPRSHWRLELPAMRRLILDQRQIPTGKEELFRGMDAELGVLQIDEGFVLLEETGFFSLEGAGRRITIEFLEGYRYAQVFAPMGYEYVALEPMTAPTNGLTTGRGLQLVHPNGRFSAAFLIRVSELSSE